MYQKPIIVISTYPSNKKLFNLLEQCIDMISKLNYDILIVSHLPIPKTIQTKVNYVLYDSVNELLEPKNSPHIFFVDELFQYKYYIGSHALPITRNIKSSLNFAKSLGYDSYLFLDSDIVFNTENIEQIKTLISEAKINNKKMILFNPEEFIVHDCNYKNEGSFFIETDFFIGDIKFTLDTLKFPSTNLEWEKNKMCYNLEVSFYTKLKEKFNDLYLIKDYSNNFFKIDNLNKNRYGLVVYDIIKNIDDLSPTFICHNSEYNYNTKKVLVYNNNKLILDRTLNPSDWSYINLNYDNSKIRVEVYDITNFNEMVHEDTKIFILNNKLKEKNNKNYKGLISFKKNIIQ